MTDQEIFDKVARHMLTQNRRVYAYRSGNLKCAIGILIPDDKYSILFEGQSVLDPYIRLAAGLTSRAKIRLAQELQAIHDDYKPKEWQGMLLRLAKKMHLDGSVVSNFQQSNSGEST